jgi:hypothetical protein
MVDTTELQGHSRAPLRGDEVVCRSAPRVDGHVLRAHLRLRRAADELDARLQAPRHRGDQGIVGVEDGQALRWHRLGQLGLRECDVGAGAELAHVGGADVEDDRDLRRGDVGEVLEVADPPGPHLDNEVARRRRDAAHGERHSDLTVERVDRSHRLPCGGQDGGEQVLGRRLAGRAGDADDPQAGRPVEHAAREPPERRLDVVDGDGGHAPDGP